MTPQHIKTKLAQLATFPDKYTLEQLAAELRLLSVEVTKAADQSQCGQCLYCRRAP